MRAPELNRRLALEMPQRLSDGMGGFSETWVVLGNLWAEITGRSGTERGDGTARVAVANYRITVRAAPPGSSMRPQPGQKLRDGNRVFRIRAVTERDPFGRFLICHAEEEVVA